MFTGLVAELGTVQKLAQQGESYHLTVAAAKVLGKALVKSHQAFFSVYHQGYSARFINGGLGAA